MGCLVSARVCAMLTALAVMLAIPFPVKAQTDEVPQIFLIQNSGWMLGYYRDRNARFREFLRDVIVSAGSGSRRILIADFNQEGQVADRQPDGRLLDRQSPRKFYDGPPVADKILAALQGNLADAPPKKKDQAGWADTDFAGALNKALTELARSQPAVVWIITNNKFAPSGKASLDSDVLAKTIAFNRELASAEAIVRLIAMPKIFTAQRQAPPDNGPEFDAKGLVIYGMAYAQAADATLIEAVKRLERAEIGDTKPATLKPLGVAPVALQLKEIQTSPPGLPWRINDAKDGLVFDEVPAETPILIKLKGNLTSNYWPQVIETARVVMSWKSDQKIEFVPGFAAGIDRATIERMRPTSILEDVTVTITIPAIPRPPGLSGYFVDSVQIDGQIGLSLEEMRLELDEDFSRKLSGIFGAASWKDVFLSAFTVTSAGRETPLRIVVKYSSGPLVLGLIAIGVALAMAVAMGFLLLKVRRYAVPVGPDRVWVSL